MKYDRAGKECKTNWPTGPLTHRTWRVEAQENMGNWPTFDRNEPRKIMDFDGNPTFYSPLWSRYNYPKACSDDKGESRNHLHIFCAMS